MRRSQAVRKILRHQRKPSELQLVSMIDIFTVMVTFLLMTAVFSRTVILQLNLRYWRRHIASARPAASRTDVGGIVWPFELSPALASAHVEGDGLRLRSGLKRVGNVRLYADTIWAAVWVLSDRAFLDGEGHGWHHAAVGMAVRESTCPQRRRKIILGVRAIIFRGEAYRHNRRAAPSSVLAGVKAFAAK